MADPSNPRLRGINTGSNDKYAYGVKTRTVTVARGNRQGNNALLQDELYQRTSKPHMTFLRTLTRTQFVHQLILTNQDLLREMQRKFYILVESGNVDLAGFIAKIMLRNGGYGFSQYHLLALALDFDPRPELKKSKSKIAIEKAAPVMAVARKRKARYRRWGYSHGVVNQKPKPISYEEPLMTKAQQMELLGRMRKANVTKKAYDNLSITPLHCVCINPNPAALEHFLDVGDDLYVYDLELRKPVHYAACSATPDNLRVLSSRGVDLRDSDKIRKTPLMYACQYGRIDNVKFILENAKCNINQKCRLARGPIHFAVEYGHFGKHPPRHLTIKSY